MSSLCQSQQRCVKASIVSSWRLAEAQDQLCSLGVHSSESLEQERARSMACPTELTNTEEEWRRKESMLGGQEPSRSPLPGAVGSWDVFDKVPYLPLSLEDFKKTVALFYCLSHLTVKLSVDHVKSTKQCLLQSIINVQNQHVEMDQDKCKTFLQKYEQELRHFGKWHTRSETSN